MLVLEKARNMPRWNIRHIARQAGNVRSHTANESTYVYRYKLAQDNEAMNWTAKGIDEKYNDQRNSYGTDFECYTRENVCCDKQELRMIGAPL